MTILEEYQRAYHPSWEPGLTSDPTPADYKPEPEYVNDHHIDEDLIFE